MATMGGRKSVTAIPGPVLRNYRPIAVPRTSYYAIPSDAPCCSTPDGRVILRGAAREAAHRYWPGAGNAFQRLYYTGFSGLGGDDCSCVDGASEPGAAGAIEGAIKAHPFIALVVAGAIGYALNGKRTRF